MICSWALALSYQDLRNTSIFSVRAGQARRHCPYKWCICVSPTYQDYRAKEQLLSYYGYLSRHDINKSG